MREARQQVLAGMLTAPSASGPKISKKTLEKMKKVHEARCLHPSLSQKEIADHLGMTVTTVSRYLGQIKMMPDVFKDEDVKMPELVDELDIGI